MHSTTSNTAPRHEKLHQHTRHTTPSLRKHQKNLKRPTKEKHLEKNWNHKKKVAAGNSQKGNKQCNIDRSEEMAFEHFSCLYSSTTYQRNSGGVAHRSDMIHAIQNKSWETLERAVRTLQRAWWFVSTGIFTSSHIQCYISVPTFQQALSLNTPITVLPFPECRYHSAKWGELVI
jgi:hypothetical protein